MYSFEFCRLACFTQDDRPPVQWQATRTCPVMQPSNLPETDRCQQLCAAVTSKQDSGLQIHRVFHPVISTTLHVILKAGDLSAL